MSRFSSIIGRLLAVVAASFTGLIVAATQATAMVPQPDGGSPAGSGPAPLDPVSPSALTSPWLIIAVVAVAALIAVTALALRSQRSPRAHPHPAS